MNERIKKLLKERHCLTSHDRYGDSHPDDYYHMYPEDIDELIELIRNDEREACAKLCEEKKSKYEERSSKPEDARDIDPEVARIAKMTCDFNAAAIRARGEP